MRKGLLAVLLMAALSLAGCSGNDGHAAVEDVTCPDGTILTAEQIEADEAHHEDGFDATTLCPVAPKVVLSGLPTSVQVYSSAPFSWAVEPGSVQHGHSMITEIRYATSSIPDAEASIETYSKPIIKKEHQDLPVTFKGNMSFTTVGKVYVRAYAAVQGDNPDGTKFARRDVWGPEIVLDVTAVAPTGKEAIVSHTSGLALSSLEGPADPVKLGDAIRFSNDEVTPLTLTLDSAPAGAPPCELTAQPSQDSAETCLMVVPGAYKFVTNDTPTPKSVEFSVNL